MKRVPSSIASLALATLASAAAQPPAAPGVLHDPREVHLADVVQLTRGGENAEAYWSPDGERLSFQSTRPPYACDQIFTMSSRAPEEPTLVSTGTGRTTCAYYTFPAGERVIFASTHAAGPDCPTPPDMSQGYVWPIDPGYDLWVARPDGSELARLTDSPGYDAEATVCPQDGRILFTSTRDGDLDLYVMNPDGSEVKRLTATPGYDGGAFFSADCTQIVWRASRPVGQELEDYRRLLAADLVRPSKLEIFVANADGSEARQVTRLGVASFAPYFFPSGERLLFVTNYADPKGRDFDVWAIDADGTDLERITWTASFDGFPIFSPDGTRLAFGSNRNQGKPGETDVYVARWIDAPVDPLPGRAEDRYAADVAWLAADEREGRGPGTAGLAAAADYIERRFREIGLAPAGEGGTFRQGFDVVTALDSGAGTSLAVDGEPAPADAYVPFAFSAPGPVEGEVVFAGWGISAPELGHDDYQGIDVRGKVALVRRFVPKLDAFAEPRDERRYSDLRYKAWNAREQGAIGLLVVDLPPPDAEGKVEEEAPLPKLTVDQQGDAGLPALAVTRAVGERLAAGGARARLAVALERTTARAENVLARLEPGTPTADAAPVLVGAHYDHLGRGGASSMAPGSEEIHNGADDNASGTAALLEAARILAGRRAELDRPVIFAAFSGEERGLLGSTTYTRQPPAGVEIARLRAMINMDMVGRLRDQKLAVLGADSAEEWRGIVEEVCAARRLVCDGAGDGYGPSDQTPFYASGVPVLHLFTGTHDDYHKPSDDAARIHATGGAIVAEVAAELARRVAERATPLTYKASPGPPPAGGDLRSWGASLGTIPDYAGVASGEPGVAVGGVRPGGPADKAGIRKGDRLVELAGREIRDIDDFMFVLRGAKPGEQARAVVVRDGERIEVEVIFGEARRRM